MRKGKDAIAGHKGWKKGASRSKETLAEYPGWKWWQLAVEDEQV